MSFAGSQAWWWPWLYITVAGVVANGAWRAAGVLIGDRLDENSEFMVLVRCVATAPAGPSSGSSRRSSAIW